MKNNSILIGLFYWLACAAIASAQTNIFPVTDGSPARRPSAPATAPRPGQSLAVNLGRGEIMPFVWIGPMKMWVGKFEVTNGQYNRFNMGHVSRSYYGHVLNAPDQPVVWVSWEDANNYCAWLTRTFREQIPSGYVFRLPVEEEWQLFASCGERRRYPWGNDWPPPDNFNYRGKEGAGLLYRLFQNEPYIKEHSDDFVVTCPVQQSGGNAWGLFGVGGNVWEWCQNWHDDQRVTRALRGACWNNSEPDIIAITNRSDAYPLRCNAMIGFRVVVAPAL